MGKHAVLGSFSFSPVRDLESNVNLLSPDNPHLYRITANSMPREGQQLHYFPEKRTCSFFKRTRGEAEFEVFVIRSDIRHVPTVQRCFEDIVKARNIDAIVLVDGGTDSLMRGDEDNVGTYHEDFTCMAAAARARGVSSKNKFLVSLGFGCDFYDGPCAVHAFENLAGLIQSSGRGYLGCFSLLRDTNEYRCYKAVVEEVMDRTRKPPRLTSVGPEQFVSIVQSSVIAATDGQFGNYHSTRRTLGTELFINPLMSLYFCARLLAVCEASQVLRLCCDCSGWDQWDAEPLLLPKKKGEEEEEEEEGECATQTRCAAGTSGAESTRVVEVVREELFDNVVTAFEVVRAKLKAAGQIRPRKKYPH